MIYDYILENIEWIFGGTKPVAEFAKEYKFFSKIFDGTEDLDEVIDYLRGNKSAKGTLETRIIDGKCMAYSKKLGRAVSEEERLSELLDL